jgi:hypothetical protein
MKGCAGQLWATPVFKSRDVPQFYASICASFLSRVNLASTLARHSVTSSRIRTCHGMPRSGDTTVQGQSRWPRNVPRTNKGYAAKAD